MIPIRKTLSLVTERLPHRAVLYPTAAGASLSRRSSAQVTAHLSTSHEVRIGRPQTFEKNRAAATVSANIDKPCQPGVTLSAM
jgi:hypothetical protein